MRNRPANMRRLEADKQAEQAFKNLDLQARVKAVTPGKVQKPLDRSRLVPQPEKPLGS